MNKTWLKRTLVGVAASAALLGSLAAYSQGDAPRGDHFHGGPPSADEIAAREAGFLAYVGKSLSLDANQAAKLQALVTLRHAQRAQHEALAKAGPDPRERAQSLIAGAKFDRAGAQKLVAEHAEHAARLQADAPALINATADFFDSLNPAQQQKVREFAGHHHGFGPGLGLALGFGPGFGEHHPGGEHGRDGDHGPEHGGDHDHDRDHKGPPPPAGN